MKSASRTNDPPRKSRAKQATVFHTGTGNVFADLGHPEPELALAKAELCTRLCDIVESRKLTDAAAGELLGTDARAVHDLLRGGFGPYTLDELRGYVHRLDESLRPHNVFADLGLPDADLLLAKADLHTAIYRRIKQAKLTKAKLAKVLGVSLPEAAALMNVEGEFTFDRLFRFLNALGHEVVIGVRPVAGGATPAETRVELH